MSSRRQWTPSPLRVPPVDPLQHVAELRRSDRHDAVRRRRPEEAPRSSRLAYSEKPSPSCQKNLHQDDLGGTQKDRLHAGRGRGPPAPAAPGCSCRRMSVTPLASHTRTPAGTGIMRAPAPPAPEPAPPRRRPRPRGILRREDLDPARRRRRRGMLLDHHRRHEAARPRIDQRAGTVGLTPAPCEQEELEIPWRRAVAEA